MKNIFFHVSLLVLQIGLENTYLLFVKIEKLIVSFPLVAKTSPCN